MTALTLVTWGTFLVAYFGLRHAFEKQGIVLSLFESVFLGIAIMAAITLAQMIGLMIHG